VVPWGEFVSVARPVSEPPSSGKWFALFLLAAANACLMVIVAGGYTWLADIIAPLTGHLIGFGLTASVALVLRRRMLTVLAAGTAATIGLHAWLGLARCCEATTAATAAVVTKVTLPPAYSSLTVLALNTWDHHGDLDRLRRYLASAPADVIVLSEFGPDKRALLQELKSVYPHQVDCADWHCELALLSRVALEAGGAARIDAREPAFVWGRFAGSVTIIGTHLHRPSRNPRRHERQISALAKFIRRIDGPLILAGDLNTSPWSNSFRFLKAATGLTPSSVLLPSWPAWPVALPQVALDHILVSPELEVTAAGTGPAVGSDHLPVWARVGRRSFGPERSQPPSRRVTSRLAAAGPHLHGEFLAHLGSEHGGARDLRR